MIQTVTIYDELRKYCAAFAAGHFEVFILLGNPGLAKSTLLRKEMESRENKWLEGTVSAFRLYCEAYWNRNKPIVIDDVDNLYGERAAIRVLKCLCQTDPVKFVGWHTAAKQLDELGVPRDFHTESKVCIIANVWKELNKNIAAVEDRGLLVDFRPDSYEVHREVGTWGTIDKEVYEFIGQHLDLIHEPSMRLYVNAEKMKKAGLDWRKAFLSSIELKPEQQLVARLLSDERYGSEDARVAEFKRETGLSRATYFRIKASLPRRGTGGTQKG
jgi:hypothetical protein